MIALPDVCRVDRPEPGRVVLDLPLSEHQAFAGHFPGQPVLPGVVQLDWAFRFASIYLGVTQPAARDFQVKFRQIIRPGCKITLLLTLNQARRYLDFEYRLDEAAASSGRIRLEAAS